MAGSMVGRIERSGAIAASAGPRGHLLAEFIDGGFLARHFGRDLHQAKPFLNVLALVELARALGALAAGDTRALLGFGKPGLTFGAPGDQLLSLLLNLFQRLLDG